MWKRKYDLVNIFLISLIFLTSYCITHNEVYQPGLSGLKTWRKYNEESYSDQESCCLTPLKEKIFQSNEVTWRLAHIFFYFFWEAANEKIPPHKATLSKDHPQHWPALQCQRGSSAFLFWLSLYVEVTPNGHWLDEPHGEEKGRCRSDAQRGSWMESVAGRPRWRSKPFCDSCRWFASFSPLFAHLRIQSGSEAWHCFGDQF